MSSPFVTIGVPVYNGSRYLRQTLESLLAQDYPSLRLLIADNASTDETPWICEEVARGDPRVSYYRHAKNIGAWRNFNFLAEQAGDPYFMWAGAHDLWAPGYVSRCVALLEAEPRVVVAYSCTGIKDGDGVEVSADGLDRIDTRGLGMLERYRRVIWGLNSCSPVHGIIRRDVLARTNLFRLDVWGADHLLLAELVLLGDFGLVDEVLFWRRVASGPETDEQRKRYVAQACLPDRAEELVRTPWPQLHRQTLQGHLDAVRAAGLAPAQRLYAHVMTLLCFHVRFLAPLADNPTVDRLLSVAIHRSRVWKAFR
jgi:glycosyltransferase involved in cell wall biosynthesis